MDLGGVWHRGQVLAHMCQGFCNQIGGALVPESEHHGGADVKGVALPLEVACAASRYDVPVEDFSSFIPCGWSPIVIAVGANQCFTSESTAPSDDG